MIQITEKQLLNLRTRVAEGSASTAEVDVFNTLRRVSAQKNFPYFCERMYEGILEWQWFQVYLQERLQKMIDAEDGFLVVQMPPQHAKTTIASSLAVPYILGRFPHKRVLLAAYNADRAKMNCDGIVKEMEKPVYKQIFDTRNKKTIKGDVADMWNENLRQDSFSFNISTHPQGSFLATSIGGMITGMSGDIMILDDYNKDAQSARSVTERNNAYEWFSSCFMTRIQRKCIIIVFATRWHDDDIIGRLLRQRASNPEEFDFELISFPSERLEPDFAERPYDPRPVGGYLWDDPAKIKHYKRQKVLSFEQYTALFLQKPMSEIGQVFQKPWFMEHEYTHMPEKFDRIVISVDTSYKARSIESDDCAITVHGQKAREWYLIEFIARRMGYVETKVILRQLRQKYKCRHIVIEERSNGGPLIEELSMEFPGIIAFEPAGMSKRARAELTTPIFADGHYHIPCREICRDKGIDIEYFLTQFLQFTGEPGGKDDCVDCVTQMLLKLADLQYHISNNSCYTVSTLASRFLGNGRGQRGKGQVTNSRGNQKTIASSFVGRRVQFTRP